jgi:type VI secretion system protein ImpJ
MAKKRTSTSLRVHSVARALLGVRHELRDANSIGQGPKTVQLSRLRLRLLPQRELTDAWIGLPLAKVTVLRSDGSIAIDANLIPPVAGYGASPLLPIG